MTLPSFLNIGFLTLFSGLCIFAAWNDVKSFRLPNKIILSIILLFIPMALLLMEWNQILDHIAVAALVLVISFILFVFKIFAAGDAKFLAAVMLWAGPEWAVELLIVMSIAGGFLAIIQYLRSHIELNYALGRFNLKLVHEGSERLELPYGVAITAGVLVVVGFQLASLLQRISTSLGG